MATGAVQGGFEVPGAEYFIHIRFSPDGHLISAIEFSGRTTIWNIAEQTRVAQFDHIVTFNPTGTLAAGIGNDGTIHLWNTATWQDVTLSPALNRLAYIAQFSPNGSLLMTYSKNGVIQLWGVPAVPTE